MTENKRFNIKPSAIVDDVTVIIDDESKYSFPVLDKELNYMFCKALNELHEENKKLQERNDRQYKQLGDLYRLIEEKDWRALSDIMDDFKKAEEQLQKEWSEYND